MNFLQEMFSNTLIISALSAWFAAQLLKTIIYLFITKKFVLERLIGSGGMPSSHSASVCGLLAAVGFEYGATGFEFAIAIVFALIVMHDAMGVRRETGNQSRIINEMIELLDKLGQNLSVEEKLKEFVGHTPSQVLAGAILGTGIGLLICITG
ncbi:MAG: divergent PAP2 family protein [Lachnospiraceae bacterium]|nr:divergent PAP2 family protein [Lachnospiraceae bacterium]